LTYQLRKLAEKVAGISLAGGKGKRLLELSAEAAIALRRWWKGRLSVRDVVNALRGDGNEGRLRRGKCVI
jgi:hypothetical protein